MSAVEIFARGGRKTADGRDVFVGRPRTPHDVLRENAACFERQAVIATEERLETLRRLEVQTAINGRLLERLLAVRLRADSNPAVKAALSDLLSEF